VTAQLVNVEDGYHIWSERYDRQMEDVFAIQDDITASIVEVLRGKLVGTAPTFRDRDQPPNLEAYHLYLKGQHNWFRREKDSLVKAARFFEQAAELDPSYVLAHVGVANSYTSLGFYGARHAAVSARAHTAIERALTLDPERAESHAGLGLMHFWLDWDYEGAEREFKRALERRPDLVLARCWYSFLLNAQGRHEESLDCMRTALEQDPLSPYAQMSLGFSQLCARHAQEAVAALERAHDTDSNFLTTLWTLGMAYSLIGRKDQAVGALEAACDRSGRGSLQVGVLAWGYASGGRRADARALLDGLQMRMQEQFVAPGFLVWGYAALGETERALEWFERSYEAHDPHLATVLPSPLFDEIRSHPRFTELRRKVLPTA
jgi:adenylate cyclase